MQKSFGFETAVSEAKRVIRSGHSEAMGARNGIGLVKLMGRESDLLLHIQHWHAMMSISALYPKAPSPSGVFGALKKRLQERGHAAIVVAEGAGQDFLKDTGDRDASGNIRFKDVGIFLRDEIISFFKETDMQISMKYIDPSYTIRSVPSNASDSAFALSSVRMRSMLQ